MKYVEAVLLSIFAGFLFFALVKIFKVELPTTAAGLAVVWGLGGLSARLAVIWGRK